MNKLLKKRIIGILIIFYSIIPYTNCYAKTNDFLAPSTISLVALISIFIITILLIKLLQKDTINAKEREQKYVLKNFGEYINAPELSNLEIKEKLGNVSKEELEEKIKTIYEELYNHINNYNFNKIYKMCDPFCYNSILPNIKTQYVLSIIKKQHTTDLNIKINLENFKIIEIIKKENEIFIQAYFLSKHYNVLTFKKHINIVIKIQDDCKDILNNYKIYEYKECDC